MLNYKVFCADCKFTYEQEHSKPTICGACGSDFIAVKLIEEPDVKVMNHGSVVMVEPVSKEAKAWVDENVGLEGWQWMGNAFAVEPRLLGNLLDGMREEGFTVGSW